MANSYSSNGESGPPPERPVGEPIRDLYPTMDARFVLVEIGKLSTKVDRLIDDVRNSANRLDDVRHQITFVKGAMWVMGGLLALVLLLGGWYLSGRLSITIKPPGS